MGSARGRVVQYVFRSIMFVMLIIKIIMFTAYFMRRQAQYPNNRDTGTDPFLYLPFSKRARLVVRRRIFIMEACAQYRFSVDLNGLDSVITFYDVPVKEV